MKLFVKEFAHSYKSYSFAYTLHAKREKNDHLDVIYTSGFLPYSGNREVTDTFYMARSARVRVKDFYLTSENKRILKKFPPWLFTKKLHSAKDFIDDEDFYSFCLDYFEKRHGKGILTRERIEFILRYSHEVYVVEYLDENKETVAYVIKIKTDTLDHYWFSFYKLDLAYKSFGIWLMLDSIMEAKENKKKFVYLGTVYGDKAIYKTNFKKLQFWNGVNWDGDVKVLKDLARSDDERVFGNLL